MPSQIHPYLSKVPTAIRTSSHWFSKRSCILLSLFSLVSTLTARAAEQVTTVNGILEGSSDSASGIHGFKGIPYAAPPVGDLRWREPQPVKNWTGVRKAVRFGPRSMQLPIFGDMNFRSDGMSEDCLYLNVWTPSLSSKVMLPVLVYFYGGGFVTGDGSEPRYDGGSMAKQGIVAVTVNYRLGPFGFMAHPELTKESPHRTSGNYGLLDQHAALEWIHRNIAAFGGDPARVTIAGESAGSISVSAQMASPLSKGLFAGAIGESGSIIKAISALSLSEAEEKGVKMASELGIGASPTLAELRAIPSRELLEKTAKVGGKRFDQTAVDGYFLPMHPERIFAEGKQMHVPLLAGIDSEEGSYSRILEEAGPTVQNYRAALERLYPGKGDEIFNLYPASDATGVKDEAQALAGDLFIGLGTWKWIDLATKTGGSPTYYYLYAHPRPPMRPEMGNAVSGLAGGIITNSSSAPPPKITPRGAVHSSEIEYVMGNLESNRFFDWSQADYKLSKLFQNYFVNFIKTGDPNGPGLPFWPQFSSGKQLIIDVTPRAERVNKLRIRYDLLDQLVAGKKPGS